jgi:oxalate---CoA ligase
VPDVPGELQVRGPLVFDGYLDDAAAFDGDWLRTGDQGHVDDDGYVFVTGRLADGVNRGGEKIAPAAVDLALERLPGVCEGAAFGIPHPALGEELVAAVVVEPGAEIDEDGWLARLRALLPPAQVPRRIVVVDALPRNDAGKVERRSLARRAGVAVGAGADDPSDGPADDRQATALEAAIAALCATALARESVGRDDDWHALGGNDEGAARVLREIESVFGVAIVNPARTRGRMTPATLARAVVEARGDKP